MLAGAAVMTAGSAGAQALQDIPLIETTPHLYDPTRPQGAPYAPNPKGVTAAELKAMAPKEVRGCVVVEASPWIEDNLWLLEAAAKEPWVVGVVGNLRPEVSEIGEYAERFGKHPMYLGIRHGNLWPGYDLPKQVADPAFVAGLKALAQADLVLDLANPRLDLLQAAVRASDAAPNLRIVLNHLAGFYPTPEEDRAVTAVLREIAQRPLIYGKISAFGMGLGAKAPPLTLAANKYRLDRLFAAFGEDRVIGGTYAATSLPVFREYFAGKSRAAAEKFFWRNSARAYKWIPRTSDQPRLA
jgi:L-fuconolactonase